MRTRGGSRDGFSRLREQIGGALFGIQSRRVCVCEMGRVKKMPPLAAQKGACAAKYATRERETFPARSLSSCRAIWTISSKFSTMAQNSFRRISSN
jgi:hypothetical protein